MLNSKFSLSRHFEYANKQITYHFWLWVFIFLYRKLNNMDEVKQQDSTPQNDSTLGFKWIKKIAQNIV
jgi:hypothetical protein